jgi:peptidoglycan/xylan/chitin deacetylase (PgdA/CDA1 family)
VAVALTFDDGPEPSETGAVLEELDRAGAPATFFVVGERAAAHPEVIVDMLRRGHAVQAHCDRHLAHPDMGDAEIADDIDRVLATLARVGAPRPTLWRVPFGRPTATTFALASERRLQVVGWTLSTADHDPAMTAAQTLSEIDASVPRRILHADSIVIMHDAIAESDRTTNAETVALIAPLASRVASRGWTLERLEAPIAPERARGDDAVVLLPG